MTAEEVRAVDQICISATLRMGLKQTQIIRKAYSCSLGNAKHGLSLPEGLRLSDQVQNTVCLVEPKQSS